MAPDFARQMRALLDAEKAALLTVNYAALAALEEDKITALAALETQAVPKDALLEIRRKMEENQTLLAAAIGGIDAARKRFDALCEVQTGLTIYDPSGKMEVVATKQSAFEKKA